jgi:hypothetical protein
VSRFQDFKTSLTATADLPAGADEERGADLDIEAPSDGKPHTLQLDITTGQQAIASAIKKTEGP